MPEPAAPGGLSAVRSTGAAGAALNSVPRRSSGPARVTAPPCSTTIGLPSPAPPPPVPPLPWIVASVAAAEPTAAACGGRRRHHRRRRSRRRLLRRGSAPRGPPPPPPKPLASAVNRVLRHCHRQRCCCRSGPCRASAVAVNAAATTAGQVERGPPSPRRGRQIALGGRRCSRSALARSAMYSARPSKAPPPLRPPSFHHCSPGASALTILSIVDRDGARVDAKAGDTGRRRRA